jgi:hypothetical protein
MAFAEGSTQFDLTTALARQVGGKGVVPTTFKNCAGIEKINPTTNKTVVEGRPYQGGDAYGPKSVGVGFDSGAQIEGTFTFDMLPILLLGGMMVKGSTTVVNTSVQHHPLTPLKRNLALPLISIYEDWGESAPGTGILTIIKRDAKQTAWSITQAQADGVRFNSTYDALNEGPGAASPTVTLSTGYIIPDPNSTVLTYPSWFPAFTDACLENVGVNWNGTKVQGPFCIGSGERSGNYVTRMGFSGDMTLPLDSNTQPIYDNIIYGTDTPGADASQMTAAIKEGPLTIKWKSLDIIPSS